MLNCKGKSLRLKINKGNGLTLKNNGIYMDPSWSRIISLRIGDQKKGKKERLRRTRARKRIQNSRKYTM